MNAKMGQEDPFSCRASRDAGRSPTLCRPTPVQARKNTRDAAAPLSAPTSAQPQPNLSPTPAPPKLRQ